MPVLLLVYHSFAAMPQPSEEQTLLTCRCYFKCRPVNILHFSEKLFPASFARKSLLAKVEKHFSLVEAFSA